MNREIYLDCKQTVSLKYSVEEKQQVLYRWRGNLEIIFEMQPVEVFPGLKSCALIFHAAEFWMSWSLSIIFNGGSINRELQEFSLIMTKHFLHTTRPTWDDWFLLETRKQIIVTLNMNTTDIFSFLSLWIIFWSSPQHQLKHVFSPSMSEEDMKPFCLVKMW